MKIIEEIIFKCNAIFYNWDLNKCFPAYFLQISILMYQSTFKTVDLFRKSADTTCVKGKFSDPFLHKGLKYFELLLPTDYHNCHPIYSFNSTSIISKTQTMFQRYYLYFNLIILNHCDQKNHGLDGSILSNE